ncbi:hypothetical protein Tco_0228929 [Tanacetum coccineum]
MEKPILNETQPEQNLAEPRVESNEKFEFSRELLTELQSNIFSGRCEEDVISHIAKEEHEYGTLPNPAAKPNLDTHYKEDGSNHEKRNKNESDLGKFPHLNNESDKGRVMAKNEKMF